MKKSIRLGAMRLLGIRSPSEEMLYYAFKEMRERGSCEWLLEHSGTLYDKWRCSECGYLFVESRTDNGIKEDFDPNYCPRCGRKVRK